MAIKSIAESFVPQLQPVNELYNAGSILLVAPLDPGKVEPDVITVTIQGTPTIGAETISLQSNAEEGKKVLLRSGSMLHFGANRVVIAADTEVGDLNDPAVNVPVEPLLAAVTGTARTWGLHQILSPTDLPLSNEAQTVNRTDLTYGLQGSEVTTKVTFAPQVSVINRLDDAGLWKVCFPASASGARVFGHIVRTGGIHGWGSAIVTGFTQEGAIEEINRIQFTMNFQAPFALSSPYRYLDTTLKGRLNELCRLSGLNVYA